MLECGVDLGKTDFGNVLGPDGVNDGFVANTAVCLACQMANGAPKQKRSS